MPIEIKEEVITDADKETCAYKAFEFYKETMDTGITLQVWMATMIHNTMPMIAGIFQNFIAHSKTVYFKDNSVFQVTITEEGTEMVEIGHCDNIPINVTMHTNATKH